MRNTWDRKELLVELCASSKPLTPANMFAVGGKGNVQLQHVTNPDMRTFSTCHCKMMRKIKLLYIFIILTPILLFKMQLSNKMITEAHIYLTIFITAWQSGTVFSPCWMNPCAEVGGILGPGGCAVLWDMWAGGSEL